MWIDDNIINKCSQQLYLQVYQPRDILVVLGRSNKRAQEVNEAAVIEDGIPVLRRYGGGGSVVLHPGCLVVSVGVWVHDCFRNAHFFQILNQGVMDFLRGSLGLQSKIVQQGISDLCFENQKFGGTSLFRSRHYLLYQASLLVDPRTELMTRYLRHPPREPEYRAQRNHQDFLVGLNQVYGRDVLAELLSCPSEKIAAIFANLLEKDISHVHQSEVSYLLGKVSRG